MFTEIKPKNGAIPDISTFNIPGYDLYTNNLEDARTRGTCIYVNNNFKSVPLNIGGHDFQTA